MGFAIKNNQKFAIVKEVTEGVYVAPSVGGDFIEASEDGVSISAAREVLEQKVIGMGLAAKKGRLGLKSASGEFSSFLKAGATAGSAPESDVLLESLFGSKRNSSEITTLTGNSSSVLKVASTASFKVGDSVVVKSAGAYHVSPIKSIVIDTSIELVIPGAGAFADNVKIAAFISYVPVNTGHPSFSASRYIEDAILEQVSGCKVSSLSIENFTTGQLPTMSFGFEGTDFDRSVSAPIATPSYDNSECPIIIDACAYQDGAEIKINEFSLSVENTISFITNTCAGKESSRVTARSVTGSINPYKADDSVSNFDKFNAGATFSLFIRCYNPTSTAGEGKEFVSFWIPKCWISELSEGDNDGVLTDVINFNATSDDGTPEVFVSFT